MSKEVRVEHRLFADDDIILKLEYPEKYLEEYTDLSEKELRERFEVIGRYLLYDILPKIRKNYRFEMNEDTGEWELLIAKTQ